MSASPLDDPADDYDDDDDGGGVGVCCVPPLGQTGPE